MPEVKQPFALLTLRRIAELTRQPVSSLQDILDEHPDIRPTATADYSPVFDRDAFLRLLSLVDQRDARREAAR